MSKLPISIGFYEHHCNMSELEKTTRAKKAISFDTLPEAISELIDRVARIEELLALERVPAEPVNETLNIAEATLILRLTKSTIYSKVCRGELPAFKAGRRLYFDKQELQDWVRSSRKKTNDDIRVEAQRYLPSNRSMPASTRRAYRR